MHLTWASSGPWLNLFLLSQWSSQLPPTHLVEKESGCAPWHLRLSISYSGPAQRHLANSLALRCSWKLGGFCTMAFWRGCLWSGGNRRCFCLPTQGSTQQKDALNLGEQEAKWCHSPSLGCDGGAVQMAVRPEVKGGVSWDLHFQGLTVGSQGPCKVLVMLGFLITARRCQFRQLSPPAP